MDEHYDVVVVGAGLAGLAAAVAVLDRLGISVPGALPPTAARGRVGDALTAAATGNGAEIRTGVAVTSITAAAGPVTIVCEVTSWPTTSSPPSTARSTCSDTLRGMATIERSVDVERPADEVWAVLEDVRQIPIYSPSTVAVTNAPERITAAGQRFRQTIVVLGRRFESEWVITELLPGRRVAMEGTIGIGARYCLVEEVDPQGPQFSRLTVRITFTMPGGLLGRLAEGLGVQRRAQREAEQVLANLKAHLESAPERRG